MTRLSDEELADLVIIAVIDVSHGVPVDPPDRLVSARQPVVTKKEWADLKKSLKEWNSAVGNSPLRSSELEFRADGLLWQTLPLTEYKARDH